MKEVSKHEQLFVSMDANSRTGRREKGQVESKDSKILGAYGRDSLCSDLLLELFNMRRIFHAHLRLRFGFSVFCLIFF